MFPFEVDLDIVRRQREAGLNGLGQVLKSFRERTADFSVYDRSSGADAYLHTLGKLAIPERGSNAGLSGRTPAEALAAHAQQQASQGGLPKEPAPAAKPAATPAHEPAAASTSPADADKDVGAGASLGVWVTGLLVVVLLLIAIFAL